MKILHVVTTLDVGGAEMHLLSQVRGQTARGHEVRMAYLKGEGRLADDFRAAGASRVVCVGAGLGAPARLWSHLGWAELVHSHLLKADMLTAVSATLRGRRGCLVSGKHNDEQVLKRPLVSLVHGVLGNLPALTIVLSDHVGAFVQRHGRVRASAMSRVYYGLDPTPFAAAARAPAGERAALRGELGLQPDDVAFVCVARFAPQKAHDVLLRAFARARDEWQGPGRIRLVLVGDDPFGDGRQQAEALAAELGMIPAADRSGPAASGDAIFCGIRRDVPAILAACDAFVMSSLWEGLGLVFLEAMATFRPVLATRVSAVPEVVVDGETGLLVAPSDPEAMARAALRLASDPDERERMGQAGSQRVAQEFGLDRMVEETLALYERVRRRP